jgi:WD40 repeat protein
MATQEEFLDLVWEQINSAMQEHWIENDIRESEQNPTAPFADLGPVLKRLLELGASRRDLSLLMRFSAYEAAFGLLYLLNDPGIDENEVEGLHESLLMADPSGLDGGPGSAPELQTAPKSKSKASRNKGKAPNEAKPKADKRRLIKSSNRVAFSPNGALLAARGKSLVLWRSPEIEEVAKISTLSNVSYFAFSPDSRQIAVKNTSGRIALVDLSTNSMKVDFRNQKDGEGSNLLFADDGAHLVDATWKGSHIVRTRDGKVTFREEFDGDMVTDVYRHPDGRYCFRHFRREEKSEKLISRRWPFERGEFEEVTVPISFYSDAVFSPDGRLLVLDGEDEHFGLHIFAFPNMGSQKTVRISKQRSGGSSVLRFSPCGRSLAVIGIDSQVILSSATLAVLAKFSIKDAFDAAFSPTHPLVAIGSQSAGEVFDTTPFLNAAGV